MLGNGKCAAQSSLLAMLQLGSGVLVLAWILINFTRHLPGRRPWECILTHCLTNCQTPGTHRYTRIRRQQKIQTEGSGKSRQRQELQVRESSKLNLTATCATDAQV